MSWQTLRHSRLVKTQSLTVRLDSQRRIRSRSSRCRPLLHLVWCRGHGYGYSAHLRCHLAPVSCYRYVRGWRGPRRWTRPLTLFPIISGEDRQLLPWELASPTVTSGTIVPMNCPSTPSAASMWDEESTYGDDKSPASSYRTQNSANPYPWEKQDAASNEKEGSVSVDIPSQSSRPPSYVSKKSDTRSLVPFSAVSLSVHLSRVGS